MALSQEESDKWYEMGRKLARAFLKEDGIELPPGDPK
jgi:hypothetical protein